jgi:hypothetical protein
LNAGPLGESGVAVSDPADDVHGAAKTAATTIQAPKIDRLARGVSLRFISKVPFVPDPVIHSAGV